jgi:hypothetical protein
MRAPGGRAVSTTAMRGVTLCLLCLCALATREARAVGSPTVSIAPGPSRCPSAEAVASAVQRLLPGTRIMREDESPTLVVRLEDHGDRFSVAIEGASREIRDRRRQCSERARAAAVFVVLALEPPRVFGDEPRAPAAVVQLDDDEPSPLLARPARRAARYSLELEAGALVDAAPGSKTLAAGGGVLRLLFGARSFGMTLGIAGVGPVTIAVPPGEVSIQRVPLDVGAYAALRRERLDVRLELGLALAPLLVQGRGFTADLDGFRLDLGVRGALVGRWWVTRRLALWLGADVTGLPRPYDLVVTNRAASAETPRVWVRVAAGLGAKID